MLPAVSTGPLDPHWSPDGMWIAFSMRGDIWKVPAAGGKAIALTQGPAYHFEPRWSPDGRYLALSLDIDGNLDIGLVSGAGGVLERLTTHAGVDIQPSWSPDGKSIIFASARSRNFDIYRIDLDSRSESPIVTGPGHQIQPSVSPDGSSLAYVSPVKGRLGSGGIWIRDLVSGTTRLVHYEETSYRAKPSWTPDGSAIVYVSDQAGSNDLAVVPTSGGTAVRLTNDGMDEYDPQFSPDGSRLVFASNREGSTTLHTIPAGGGGARAWRAVAIRSLTARLPTGRLSCSIVDETGRPTPARIQLIAGDGRSYTPADGFHRVVSATETHYFHSRGTFVVDLPAGQTRIEALKGFEFQPAGKTVEITAGATLNATLQLKRMTDPTRKGWYSGDTHVHDLHQGRFGLTPEDLFSQAQAEDLRVTNALIHMDGTRLMGRWEDLIGEPHPLSNTDNVLYYSQEFRSAFGHVGLLGLRQFITPLVSGVGGTPYAADRLNADYLDHCRRQGGIGGFLHPYTSFPSEPEAVAGSEIPVDVALGKGDFYDVVCLASDERASAQMYYKFLNCGFRLPATGGTDNFSDVWRDPPPGSARTYAQLKGPLSFGSWIAAVKAGRTFATNGPLLFMDVEGKVPGEDFHPTSPGQQIKVNIEVYSVAPLETVELLVNGEVIRSLAIPALARQYKNSVSVATPERGWIAARALGPGHRYIADSYAFAHTSPVYIGGPDQPFTSPKDARFLLAVVNAFWDRVQERKGWRSSQEQEHFRSSVTQAAAIYEKIAASGR